MENIEIRKAQHGDLSEILILFTESIHAVCKADYRKDQLLIWAAASHDRHRWVEKIEQHFFLVAQCGKNIVGFGSLNGDIIDLLYVHKDHLRQGIATRILSGLEQEVRKSNCIFIKASVSKTGLPFFEKHGYKIMEEQRVNIQGVEIINYRMEKAIGA